MRTRPENNTGNQKEEREKKSTLQIGGDSRGKEYFKHTLRLHGTVKNMLTKTKSQPLKNYPGVGGWAELHHQGLKIHSIKSKSCLARRAWYKRPVNSVFLEQGGLVHTPVTIYPKARADAAEWRLPHTVPFSLLWMVYDFPIINLKDDPHISWSSLFFLPSRKVT